ncbi:MAG: LPS export ABC transporter ATP-binding protein [Pontiellaceae bacterium]
MVKNKKNISRKKLLIKTTNLQKNYNGRLVVNSVNLSVSSGEIVGLLGPNGAGKTTSFNMIVGLIKSSSGEIFFHKENISDLPMYKRARLGIGYLSQEPSIFRKLTVKENVLSILQTLPISNSERLRRLDILLKDLKIDHLSDQKALSLSGGERRRLEITRALVTEPSILLLDEPFSGVDPLAINDVQDILLNLKKQGIGILITDHNVRDTLDIVDRAYLLCEGKILCEGDKDFLINDKLSKELYLGSRFNI